MTEHKQQTQEVTKKEVQDLLRKTGLASLRLNHPFTQTIKPQDYLFAPDSSSELPSNEAIVTSSKEGAVSKFPESQGRQGSALETSAFDASLQRLPLLSLEESAPEEPQESSDLRILALLGEGGMGKVSLAQQHSLEREVALKSVKSTEPSPVAVEALLHEGKLMGALSHPNIPPVHALGRNDTNHPVMVMKRIDGVSWQELLDTPEHPTWKGLPSDEQLLRHLEIFMDVCNAVAFAHQQGIIHRDIKPENVMIGAFGEVLLLDWGLGLRLIERKDENSAGFVGTPSYMAPEMLSGKESQQSHKTDVYLLGATLHTVLMRSPRHPGLNIHQVIFSVIESNPYAYPAHIPEALGAICNKATDKEPEQRFDDVLALKDAVATYLRHRGSLQLTEVAEQRLEELKAKLSQDKERRGPFFQPYTGGDPQESELGTTIRSLFSECEFAFLQGLHQWSENPRAHKGLQTCLEWMCSYELRIQHIESAEAILKRIDVPPPELLEELSTVKALIKERQKLQFEQAAEISATARRTVIFSGGVLLSLTCFLVHFLRISGVYNPGHEGFWIAQLVSLGFLACMGVVFRSALFKNNYNRQMYMLLIFAICGIAIMRIFYIILGLSLAQAATLDFLAIYCYAGAVAILVDKRMGVMALGYLLMAIAIWVWPKGLFVFSGIAHGVAAMNIGHTWKFDQEYTPEKPI